MLLGTYSQFAWVLCLPNSLIQCIFVNLDQHVDHYVRLQAGAVLDAELECCDDGIDACGMCGGDNTTCAAWLQGYIDIDIRENWAPSEMELTAAAATDAFYATLTAAFGVDFPLDSVKVSNMRSDGPASVMVRTLPA